MMKNMRVLLTVAGVALIVVMFVGMAKADDLVITDPSFENTVYDPGLGASLTGRIASGNWIQVNGDTGTAIVWHPFPGAFDSDTLPSPADGSQCLANADPDVSHDTAVIQLLSVANPVLGTVQPGYTYTITVAVGVPNADPYGRPANFQGITIGFGDNDLGGFLGGNGVDHLSQVGIANGTTGVFFDYSFSFKADDFLNNPDSGVLQGDALGAFIDLGGPGTVADNVRVSAVSDVPEPSTLVLLAAGMVGLLAYAWRKRK